jgi:3',5'-cyclic AMP phosphodiesterase CpdA
MTRFAYPALAGKRGYRYWFRWSNIWAARQQFARLDYSNEWRHSFGQPEHPDRSLPLRRVVSPRLRHGTPPRLLRGVPRGRSAPPRPMRGVPLRIVLLGDTGEGDHSQYGLVPLLRAMNPDMLVINGDVAYPAGRAGTWRADENDFLHGFFQPYRNFDIPVWATPGNHEYYSEHHGKEFHDIFCTRRFDRLWDEHGLRHTHLQPGNYWELDDLQNSGLVLIGLDTGKDGNLDGRNFPWQIWKRKVGADERQLSWFEDRLRRVQEIPGGKAIVLFHIPALTREREVELSLRGLHRILSRYPCVRLVLCAHDHNHQQYTPEVFRRYLSTLGKTPDPAVRPHYIVNGGGGGYLESTMYPRGPFPGTRFPSAEEWKGISTRTRQVVGRFSRDKGVLSRLMGIVAKDVFMDADEPVFLSFILLEIDGHTARVTPVFLRALSQLYSHDTPTVRVQEADPPPDPAMVRRCLQNTDNPSTGQQDLSFVL